MDGGVLVLLASEDPQILDSKCPRIGGGGKLSC